MWSTRLVTTLHSAPHAIRRIAPSHAVCTSVCDSIHAERWSIGGNGGRTPSSNDMMPTTAQCRTLSSGRNYRESKKKTSPSRGSTAVSPRIQPRPPPEPNVESKFALPDRDKEQALGRLQTQVMELHRSGQYQKALTAAKELLTETTSHFTRHHPATAAAYLNTGLMRKLLGDFDAARADYTTAQTIYQETVGTDHASYASALHNLGNLNRTQIHLDSTLSATDRLSLVESALQFLQQAHAIRLAELGPEHSHTVASRSSWGATLAARVLHHHKVTEVTTTKTSRDLVQQRFYISLLPTVLTETAWDAAEEHLRQAYETSLAHPRGRTVAQTQAQTSLPNATKFPLPPSRGKKKPMRAEPIEAAVFTSPQTLSAAAAAQNLAVFLKARATTVQPYNETWLTEAEDLYRKAMSVQAVLLPDPNHPDRYVTQHSLAELLDIRGDTAGANALRQDMVDTYDPTVSTDEDSPSEDDSSSTDTK